MKFNKLVSIFAAFMILALAITPQAFAIKVLEDGTEEGQVSEIKFSTGMNVAVQGKRAVVTTEASDGDYAGNVTFQSTLTAQGRAGGASTMSSSSTYLSAAGIAYAVINKRIGGGGGLDGDGKGSLMVAGKNGQRLTFLITAVQSGGEWKITENGTGWNWNTVVFNAVDDMLTMDYISGLGWIIADYVSVAITRNQLP